MNRLITGSKYLDLLTVFILPNQCLGLIPTALKSDRLVGASKIAYELAIFPTDPGRRDTAVKRIVRDRCASHGLA